MTQYSTRQFHRHSTQCAQVQVQSSLSPFFCKRGKKSQRTLLGNCMKSKHSVSSEVSERANERRKAHERSTLFFFNQNLFYKNIKAEIAKKIRTLLRTFPASNFWEKLYFGQIFLKNQKIVKKKSKIVTKMLNIIKKFYHLS